MSVDRLILASASPRRRDLLASLGVDFCCHAADIDESVGSQEAPGDYVLRMARCKAAAIAAMAQQETYAVLGADTTVVVDGDILGKPRSHRDALETLSCLSGRCHTVITAVCLHTQDAVCYRFVETDVHFVVLDRQVCEAYLATDEPWDKAGSYAIQGLGGAFVREIRGSYSSVVGLPLTETWELLCEQGIPTTLSTHSLERNMSQGTL